MQKTYILISLFLVVALSFLAVQSLSNKNIQPVACTMEAKLCPNGTSVGRTGPNCEFSACPEVVPTPVPVSTSGDVTLGVGQKGNVGDLAITVNSIVQDSRCPVGVQCIWAGEVKVNVTLLGKTKTEAKIISSIDKPYSFDGYSVSIINVTRGEYRITFHVAVDTKKDGASTGTISGRVTLSPTCPVERIPPEPQCAPRPYQTKVDALSSDGSKLIKSTESGTDGNYTLTLPFGNYRIQAKGGTTLPRCASVAVSLKTATSLVDISCDTGIR